MANQRLSLEERLNAHPQLRGRMEAVLAIVEDGNAEVTQADEAERRMIEAVRRLGQEALCSWAVQQEGVQSATMSQPGIERAGKKNSTGTPPLAR
jgi:hypothetical protein